VHSSVYLPEAVYEALLKAAFEKRRKIHDLVLEGVALAHQTRGIETPACRVVDGPGLDPDDSLKASVQGFSRLATARRRCANQSTDTANASDFSRKQGDFPRKQVGD